ncbi:uncharacterized protein LOC127745827 [Arachis duranensis]|uniref:Uncharacterized protein LOC127745827 n=1 Tax=Arachis duranensis TaxID=130453 RepID=A0A9C6TFQ4_ARADU|nr:uncharacterized protein LOC127745827 [Arachis duranensis]XP_052115725.1 uncharacterized protein LOC127745827 [Arachis duranensis]
MDLKEEVKQLREDYVDLEESVAEGTEEVFEISKKHVQVLAPDLDLSPLHPDKIVVDGKIVSPPHPPTDSELKTAGQRLVESPPQEVVAPEEVMLSSSLQPKATPTEENPPTSSAEPDSSPAHDQNPLIGYV